MGPSGKRKIDIVVQIDPILYYQYPYRQKYEAAEALGKINRHYRGKGLGLLLMTPGRIGTSSPELGVPVTFGDISGFSAICEISESRAGYMPELSYGSHMFQDLVEARISMAPSSTTIKPLFTVRNSFLPVRICSPYLSGYAQAFRNDPGTSDGKSVLLAGCGVESCRLRNTAYLSVKILFLYCNTEVQGI